MGRRRRKRWARWSLRSAKAVAPPATPIWLDETPVDWGAQTDGGTGARDRVWALAMQVRDAINAIPNSQHHEYGAVIYRNARGRLKSQPVRKMPNRSGGEFPKLPPGAVRVAEVHNHPYLQGLALASNAPNYDQAAIDRYLHGVLARPSQADVIRMRFWESQGQAVRTLIVGPDGVLRSY